jgi:BED zinc finger
MPSFVWDYFEKIENGLAQCTKCSKKIIYQTGTKGMIGHLKSIHNITNSTSNKNLDGFHQEPIAKKQKLITAYGSKPSLEEEVAKLTCAANLPFNQIVLDYQVIKQSMNVDN